MSNERLRVVLDPAYANALGVALYCFALCEWNAIYCIQKHQPGYVAKNQSTMAGTVAQKLCSITSKLSETPKKQKWERAAKTFCELVKTERNHLVHAKPATNEDGEQRLFYFDFEWTIERIEDVANKFTKCSIDLSKLYHT